MDVRAIAARRGYGLDAEAFERGYEASKVHTLTETDRFTIAYPGPERSAWQAGWIQQQLDAITERARPSEERVRCATCNGNGGSCETCRGTGLVAAPLGFRAAMEADGVVLASSTDEAHLAIEWALNLEGGDHAKALDRIRADETILAEAKGLAEEVLA